MSQEVPHQASQQITESQLQSQGLDLLGTVTTSPEAFAVIRELSNILSTQDSIASINLGTTISNKTSSTRRDVIDRLKQRGIVVATKALRSNSSDISTPYHQPLHNLLSTITALLPNGDSKQIDNLFPSGQTALANRKKLVESVWQEAQKGITTFSDKQLTDITDIQSNRMIHHILKLRSLGVLQQGTQTQNIVDLQKLNQYHAVFDAATDLARAMQPQVAPVQEMQEPVQELPAEIAEEPLIETFTLRRERRSSQDMETDENPMREKLTIAFDNNEPVLLTATGHVLAVGDEIDLLVRGNKYEKTMKKDLNRYNGDPLIRWPVIFFWSQLQKYQDRGTEVYLVRGKFKDSDVARKSRVVYTIATALEKARAITTKSDQLLPSPHQLDLARKMITPEEN